MSRGIVGKPVSGPVLGPVSKSVQDTFVSRKVRRQKINKIRRLMKGSK